jgi:glycosyltransferase involved in cell wall biosynthesis
MAERPLKVLQVVSSSAAGGAERHALDLSDALKRRGHYVKLMCPDEGWITGAAREAEIPIEVSPMRRLGWFATGHKIGRHVRDQHIDVIHTHLTRASYIGMAAGLKAHVPVVTTVHLLNNDKLYRRLAQGRNRLVAVSEFVQTILHEKGVARDYIDTVYNGTDFLGFEPANGDAVRADLGIPRDRRVIGIVGRVCRSKGHLEMVRALKKVIQEIPNAHAVFVGRIEEGFRDELLKVVEEEGVADHITFTGVRSDVPRVIDAFDVSAMPSHMETFGLAAIEAMARARPVIASNVGALPEIVSHGKTGLLVPVGEDNLAEAVAYLLGDDRAREEMGRHARSEVEARFSLNQMGAGLEGVYRKALTAS